MPDSTLQDLLNILSAPALSDLLIAVDVSDSNTPKKLPLSILMSFIMDNNDAFSITGGFKLLQALNANGYKISSLDAGTDDGDSVNYSQVKAGIMSLAAITPSLPSASDSGAFLRLVTATITNPWGGFYLFYWCVDAYANTVLSLSGGTVVASSGATVYFDGSVANVVNVIKPSGWAGKYFHCAVIYRNLSYSSPISATRHLYITSPNFNDIIRTELPKQAENLALTCLENRLFITADASEGAMPGDSYLLELLFDTVADTKITGNEEGLVRLSSSSPVFTYDIPLSTGNKTYAHARIVSISLLGVQDACATAHCALAIDTNVLSDTLLNYLALKVSERVVTESDLALKMKV